jgi:L-lysine 6-transaminase
MLSFPVTDAVIAQVERLEEQAVEEIQRALVERKDDIAALIIEPIQGEGGDNHFRPEFLRKLRRLADENEFLLICDEIQTGVGTTGAMWAWQHTGIVPDIFAFGKKTQVCGIAVNNRIDDVDSVFKVSSRINSTWGGNLTDMYRATKYFEIIAAENLVENARVVGEHLRVKLQAIGEEMPHLVTNVRGKGLFLALDLPNTEIRGKALQACLNEGLMALASGSRAIRMRPALNLKTAEADEAVSKLRRALQSLAG